MQYSKVTARSSAKINLLLQVGEKQANGYHDVVSVMQTVSLYETVTATVSEKISLTAVHGKYATGTPLDENNLAVKAAQLLATETGTTAGAKLEINKTIPVAGGMAGGSADAAATLVACNTLWGTKLNRQQLIKLASKLGADVPFALQGETALALGNGSILTPVLGVSSLRWVVAHIAAQLSTAKIFQELDELRLFTKFVPPNIVTAENLIQKLHAANVFEIGNLLQNDLEVAALSLRPDLQTVLAAGKKFGAAASLLSGSGPSIIFLVEENFPATKFVQALHNIPQVLDVYEVFGPVAGAEVVESVW